MFKSCRPNSMSNLYILSGKKLEYKKLFSKSSAKVSYVIYTYNFEESFQISFSKIQNRINLSFMKFNTYYARINTIKMEDLELSSYQIYQNKEILKNFQIQFQS
jgi:hypothetical protein